ncbi:MAG: hypothetical protein H7A25_02250 [Leptospiraceae bacterium]|nr:hypothetical protein [Leptospiraceae bacterium]MCP5498698.1 hypothetical protein [Leptospiraceae bacterium]
MIEKLLLLLVLLAISLLIILAQTYANWKEYADILISLLSITGSLLAIYEFIRKKR